MTDTAAASRRAFAARFGELRDTRSWWVPGRVELLGKHVDYAGGRSLLCAIDRGMTIVARPRSDDHVHLLDARSGQTFVGALRADLAHTPGRWTDYVISVLRRVARDFPGASRGMDAAVASNLPSAAGLSSSSALVVAVFLPLAAFNGLDAHAAWPGGDSEATLAGYLGAMENGKAFGTTAADFGVGTQGGSQDHLAILAGRDRAVCQARFLPPQIEGYAPFPEQWQLVIASSGIAAAKGAAVRDRYNALAAAAATLLARWRERQDAHAVSLLDVLTSSPEAEAMLMNLIADHPDREALANRLTQFRIETTELVPAARAAIAAADATQLGDAVARSFHLGAAALQNQVPETLQLTETAQALGAIAASPFGAGFGGSVYSVVARGDAERFRTEWSAAYYASFPAAAAHAEFLDMLPAAGAHELPR